MPTSNIVLAVRRVAYSSLTTDLRVAPKSDNKCIAGNLFVPPARLITTPRACTSWYEETLEVQRVAVIFTWLVKLGEPCCPAEADSSGELVEGVWVLVAVRNYADALVVLGP
jgi:hypothetical protein